MAAIADPTTEFDTIVLSELDFDLTPKCDNESCDNDATHTITCPCTKGSEFSCYTCIMSMKQAALDDPDYAILFDPQKSCGHVARINDCTINPL
jgi:hypothetical protein